MKQILQSLKTGETKLIDIPCPQLKDQHLLINTLTSLISSGTEKMLVDFGKASMLEKARREPDKVKQVFDKIKTDGLLSTLSAVQSKLDQLLPMGYCNVGRVAAVGAGVTEFAVGDYVVSNGAHAEIVSVPKNLCCKVPASVPPEHAAFTILGAIALQGIRLAMPALGENIVVMGLGLIGLLTVQLLRAQGCNVLGVDIDAEKTALAKQFGVHSVDVSLGEDPLAAAHSFSRGQGVDGVLITASSKSHDLIHQAASMCRKRGRIVLVGVTGLNLSRADFYKKELSFQVSCSYGPGRYDPVYENQGQDYPLPFVRFTAQRNFAAFLDLLARHAIDVQPLISHHFPLSEANQAYDLLANNKKALGILIHYNKTPEAFSSPLRQMVQLNLLPNKNQFVCLGVIGAGNYASRILIPAFKRPEVKFKQIACHSGISGTFVGSKFKFAQVTTDVDHIFSDQEINTVVIASRHDSHAEFVCRALKAYKHIFIEKPLCLTLAELDGITAQWQQTPQLLMIGFNRRFSPHIQTIKRLLSTVHEPASLIMTVNAGEIPKEHWTQDHHIGGGRLIGEVCHFIDLLRYLTGERITSFHLTRLEKTPISSDKVSISLTFADGSFGVVHYLANGHHAFPKERLEIFVAGKILQLDNYRKLRGHGWPQFKRMNLWRQDKGQKQCVNQFIQAVKQALPSPIPFEEIIEVSKVTIEIAGQVQS